MLSLKWLSKNSEPLFSCQSITIFHLRWRYSEKRDETFLLPPVTPKTFAEGVSDRRATQLEILPDGECLMELTHWGATGFVRQLHCCPVRHIEHRATHCARLPYSSLHTGMEPSVQKWRRSMYRSKGDCISCWVSNIIVDECSDVWRLNAETLSLDIWMHHQKDHTILMLLGLCQLILIPY